MNTLIKDVLALLPDGDGYKTKTVDIAVTDDRITGIGSIPADFKADKTINGSGKFAIPGLVNAHTHCYMTLFRNAADDLAFDDWLFRRIFPMEDRLQPDDYYLGTMLGCVEMIRTGTTAFLDMNICREDSARAVVDSKLKAVISRGLVGNGRDDEGGIRRIEDTLYDLKKYGDNKRLKFMMGPHAIYTTDEEFLRFVIEKADEYKMGIHVHLSESVKEIEDCIAQRGCSPVEYLDSIGMFDRHTVAAHCVQLSDKDIEILAKKGVYAATNPISNSKLGNGFARLPEMLEKGVKIALGTDSAASNNTLNMFDEMRYLTLCHKGNTRLAQCISAVQAIKMATENGAAALGLDDTGALKEGYKADIVLLDLSRPSMRPMNNPIASLCYSASGYEVTTVLVDGETVMENGEIPHIDEEKLYFECEQAMKHIDG